MKFYSEILHKVFDTSKELKEAEQAYAAQNNRVAELKKKAKEHIDAIAKEMIAFNDIAEALADKLSYEEASELFLELFTKLAPVMSKF